MTCLQQCKCALNYLKRWKEGINHIQWPKQLLQHDEATPHTSVATSTAIHSIIFEVIPHPPFSTDLTLTSGCLKLSRNISKEIISHFIKFKLLSEAVIENSQKSSTVTG
jgi:hypothetical protein